MGYALSWLAIKGKDPDTILRQLQFEETPQKEEFPESDLAAIQLGEWYIIIGNGDWVVPLSQLDFASLSKRRQLVFFNIEEHVMFSYTSLWENGKEKCQVIHESSSGLNHLLEEGIFPPQYKDIKDHLLEKQRNEVSVGREMVDHVIDIPVELAHSLVGYRHDNYIEGREFMYTVLKHNPKLKRERFGSDEWAKQLFLKFIWYPIVKKKKPDN